MARQTTKLGGKRDWVFWILLVILVLGLILLIKILIAGGLG